MTKMTIWKNGLEVTANICVLLQYEQFKRCLLSKTSLSATNKGFRVHNNHVETYTQVKDGLPPIYNKREVLSDGRSTIPLRPYAPPT